LDRLTGGVVYLGCGRSRFLVAEVVVEGSEVAAVVAERSDVAAVVAEGLDVAAVADLGSSRR
jgi:Trk K+ transport system NAD-binding subunit